MTSAVEREQYQDCKLEATKQQTLRGPAEALALALASAETQGATECWAHVAQLTGHYTNTAKATRSAPPPRHQ